ncbi:TIGR03086 family metal-binding protein [Micromonospora sp. NPDC049559]|uniref:TIGR03086 family metal-binding protein n=1 Tax=Micromonospora sp. NPDC049559 TaxID=3155923 RepID=UPI0034459B3F
MEKPSGPPVDAQRDPRQLHQDAAVVFADLLAGVRPGQWTDPTGCPDWDVRGLVNHVVNGNLRFLAIVTRRPVPDRDEFVLGEDPVEAFHTTLAALVAEFARDDVPTGEFLTPGGPEPGHQLVRTRFIELLVHGWDLARATGQNAELDPALCRACLDILRRRSLPRGPGRPFAEERPATDALHPADRLAAFAGRDVTRTPRPGR